MLLQSLLKLATFAGLASSASLKQVSSFGANPTGLQMYIYVPDKLAASPAVIVAVSYLEEPNGSSSCDQAANTTCSCTPAADLQRDGTPGPSSLRTPTSSVSFSFMLAQPR
jgi:hypothetical protein